LTTRDLTVQWLGKQALLLLLHYNQYTNGKKNVTSFPHLSLYFILNWLHFQVFSKGHISSPKHQNDICKSLISNLSKIPITSEKKFELNQQGFVLTFKSLKGRHSDGPK